MYGKYSELNLPGRETSVDDQKKSELILKDLVIVDTKIINSLSNFSAKVKDYDARIAALVVEKNALSDKLIASDDRLFIIYIASGAIVCLLVVSLIFVISGNIRYRKLKKKNTDFNEMLRSADNDKVLAKQLTDSLTAKEKELSEKNALLTTMQKEKATFENKINEIQSKLDEIKNQPPPPAPVIITNQMTNEESTKFDANLVKIEKLGRMKDLGIVTEEEFNTFRKKFLGEL